MKKPPHISNHGSFLRWAGSKRKSIGLLRAFWKEDFGKYIEPFAGSAVLFFHISPPSAILSDINTDLIGTLQAVRNAPLAVFHSLRSRPVNADYYYSLRGRHSNSLSKNQRAARFVYLNRFCFNGIYRTNKQGEFNVPFGSKTGAKPKLEHLTHCSKLLRNAVLEQGDFDRVVRKHTKVNDFVYLDPPYVTGARRVFNEYDSKSFSLSDLERLGKLLSEIDARRAKFVLSYAYCPEAIELFSKWNSRKYYVQRNVAGFASGRRMAAELVVTNIDS